MIPPPLLFINIKYILLLFFHRYNSPPPISYHCRLFSCGPTLHYHRPTPTPPSPLLSSTLTSLPYHTTSSPLLHLHRLSTFVNNNSAVFQHPSSQLLTPPLRSPTPDLTYNLSLSASSLPLPSPLNPPPLPIICHLTSP